MKETGEVLTWGSYTNIPVDARSGVKAIAAGYTHSLALKANGTVVGWGYENYGEATPPAGLSNVIAIAGGAQHSIALKEDGSVVKWGFYPFIDDSIPEAAKSGVVAIAAGFQHNVALKSDGTIVQWRLGWDTNLANIPQDAQSGIVAISAGYRRTAVVKSNGSVISWRIGETGPLITPPDASNGVAAVAIGSKLGSPYSQDYIVALKQDGTVVCWGTISNAPAAFEGNGRFRAVAAGGESALLLYEPKLPVIAPFTFRYWTGPTGPVVSISSSASLDSLAPFATAQWHLNGQPIEGVPTTNLVFSGHLATLRIPIVSTNQSGIYTIVYSNDAGSVTSAPLAEIDVRMPWITQISLEITRLAHESRIAWHTNAWDLILQSTTNLNPPVTWTDWAETPSVIGSQFVVTNRPAAPHQYFRLFRPFD